MGNGSLGGEVKKERVMKITVEIHTRHVRVLAVLAILVGVVGAPLLARGGSVSLPHTFVNGQIADADDVNANFTALASAVNDNDARIGNLGTLETSSSTSLVAAINEVRHGAQAVLPSAARSVAGLVSVPAGGLGDVRPPVGETWTVQISPSFLGGSRTIWFTDGSKEIRDSVGTANSGTTISNSIWIRLRSAATTATAYFEGVKESLPFVGTLTTVGSGQTLELRPPTGEVWIIDQTVTSDESNHVDLTDGTLAVNHSFPGGIVTRKTSIAHGLWIRYLNTTGVPIDIMATGVKAP